MIDLTFAASKITRPFRRPSLACYWSTYVPITKTNCLTRVHSAIEHEKAVHSGQKHGAFAVILQGKILQLESLTWWRMPRVLEECNYCDLQLDLPLPENLFQQKSFPKINQVEFAFSTHVMFPYTRHMVICTRQYTLV